MKNNNTNFVLTFLPTGDFCLTGSKASSIIKSNDLERSLFLLNISSSVRDALRIEIDELSGTHWEFDKDILFYSEFNFKYIN